MTSPAVLIVVPTYNERENLPTLNAALMAPPNTRVMVVDDRSPDGTGDLADPLVREHVGLIAPSAGSHR